MKPNAESFTTMVKGEGPENDSLVWTKYCDPFPVPPVRKPRALIVELGEMPRFLSCHPSAVLEPAPRNVQFVPSVDASKVVRQSSGVAPSLIQLTEEPSNERDSL